MRNQLFLSYFVDRFKDRPLPKSVARICLPVTIAVPAACVWLVLVESGATVAGVSALAAVLLATCMARGFVAYRKLKVKTDQLQKLARALLATNTDCLKVIDVEGRIMQVSEVGADLMELSSHLQLVGADWLSFWKGDDEALARDAFRRALAGEEATFLGTCPTYRGTVKWWSATLYPLIGSNGRVSAILCPSRDLTAQTVALHEAQRAQTLLKDVEAHIPVVFWSASPDLRTIHHVSAGFELMWHMPLSALLTDPVEWQDRLTPEDLQRLRRIMFHMTQGSVASQEEFQVRRESGGPRWIRASVSPVFSDLGVVERIVSVCIDITEEKLRIAELDRIANVDSLTGLANRRALVEHLQRRCDSGTSFSLLLADVDRFKVLNDTAGAVMADDLLRDIGRAIKDAVPADALVARAGGDEFAIVLAGTHTLLELTNTYEAVRRRVGEPHWLGSSTVSIALSAGIASFPEHGCSPDALMSSADVAMYAAKHAGRDTYRVFGSEESAEIDKFQLQRELAFALARGEFVLHFQPLFSVADRELSGVEALIRWNKREQGLISPCVFVPLLEETGLIRDVGQWVFDESLRQMVAWGALRSSDFFMSINVSAQQLGDECLPRRFAESALLHGVPTRNITLEITESSLVQQGELKQNVVGDLQRLGFRIALDDFGTGYSSLSYLTRLRPDVLKLDRSLVVDIDHDANARTVVTGIVALAKALNIRVTAEGVERETQLNVLADMDCEMVQGFLLARPETPTRIRERFGADNEGVDACDVVGIAT